MFKLKIDVFKRREDEVGPELTEDGHAHKKFESDQPNQSDHSQTTPSDGSDRKSLQAVDKVKADKCCSDITDRPLARSSTARQSDSSSCCDRKKATANRRPSGDNGRDLDAKRPRLDNRHCNPSSQTTSYPSSSNTSTLSTSSCDASVQQSVALNNSPHQPTTNGHQEPSETVNVINTVPDQSPSDEEVVVVQKSPVVVKPVSGRPPRRRSTLGSTVGRRKRAPKSNPLRLKGSPSQLANGCSSSTSSTAHPTFPTLANALTGPPLNSSLDLQTLPRQPMAIRGLGLSSSTSSLDQQRPKPVSCMHDLLDWQWDQTGALLMQQVQGTDIAALLNQLHQIKSENDLMEAKLVKLTSKFAHLKDVNDRLRMSLLPPPVSPTTSQPRLLAPEQHDSQDVTGRASSTGLYAPPLRGSRGGVKTGSSRGSSDHYQQPLIPKPSLPQLQSSTNSSSLASGSLHVTTASQPSISNSGLPSPFPVSSCNTESTGAALTNPIVGHLSVGSSVVSSHPRPSPTSVAHLPDHQQHHLSDSTPSLIRQPGASLVDNSSLSPTRHPQRGGGGPSSLGSTSDQSAFANSGNAQSAGRLDLQELSARLSSAIAQRQILPAPTCSNPSYPVRPPMMLPSTKPSKSSQSSSKSTSPAAKQRRGSSTVKRAPMSGCAPRAILPFAATAIHAAQQGYSGQVPFIQAPPARQRSSQVPFSQVPLIRGSSHQVGVPFSQALPVQESCHQVGVSFSQVPPTQGLSQVPFSHVPLAQGHSGHQVGVPFSQTPSARLDNQVPFSQAPPTQWSSHQVDAPFSQAPPVQSSQNQVPFSQTPPTQGSGHQVGATFSQAPPVQSSQNQVDVKMSASSVVSVAMSESLIVSMADPQQAAAGAGCYLEQLATNPVVSTMEVLTCGQTTASSAPVSSSSGQLPAFVIFAASSTANNTTSASSAVSTTIDTNCPITHSASNSDHNQSELATSETSTNIDRHTQLTDLPQPPLLLDGSSNNSMQQ